MSEMMSGGFVAVDIHPGVFYHAIWYWVLCDVQNAAVVARDPDDVWTITIHSDLPDTPAACWSRPGECTREEREQLLQVAYESAQKAGEKMGEAPTAPLKISLECDGAKAATLLRGLVKLGRLPKGMVAS